MLNKHNSLSWRGNWDEVIKIDRNFQDNINFFGKCESGSL